MKKIFYCILPFIIIWGGYFSLLFVPQFHYEYLGTVNSNIVVTVSEHQSDNDYYYLFNYNFTYEDETGKTRSSENIHINETWKYMPSRGFNSRSDKSWIVKQLLENGKVYAPGWKFSSISILAILGSIIFIYWLIKGIDHLVCYIHELNYGCGYDESKCFGCPFCVTDKQTINKIKIGLNKPKEGIKKFFGYV